MPAIDYSYIDIRTVLTTDYYVQQEVDGFVSKINTNVTEFI